MLVGVVAIQAATFTIFLFEWLSPSGFDMKQVAPAPNHRFSLFRTYWLVWAVLFQAAVHVDSPRGFTARFMTNVWAMFAVVFLAIYTANLAAFMITREEFHEFSGIDDHRLAKPFSNKPMYKFGTIPWSHTDSTLNKYFKEMHAYMRTYNRTTVAEGIVSVLNGIYWNSPHSQDVLSEVKEGFGNQINLCRDQGLNSGPQHRSLTPYP
uniref:(California timema) hypothetical protein n=1 Tax=Timema californicum TaxID=61474 RepID=A0A7R9J8W9_TIMCA|nr:unnamed protein product [Timema californicum]